MSTAIHRNAGEAIEPRTLSRIAVGIDGFAEGEDAAALGSSLAEATGADLLLAAVLLDPLVVLPAVMNWRTLHEEAETAVRHARNELAAGARVTVETDTFVARGLERVVKRQHRQLLVVGSTRHGHRGEVRIGRCTRQLLHDATCAVAVAPRGLRDQAPYGIRRIGVGYDGGPEAGEALALAAGIAAASGAELQVCGVVDDRSRPIGWSRIGTGAVIVPALGWEAVGSTGANPDWEQVVGSAERSLAAQLTEASAKLDVAVRTEVRRGRPAGALFELCESVDLMIIGSRRWGPVARLLLGSTGEALLHGARTPVIVVPRPKE